MPPVVRKHQPTRVTPAPWRELESPPAANDVSTRLPPLSRGLPKDAQEIAQLRATLHLEQTNDLRAAAMLVMLGLGLRKREIVALDVADVVTIGAVVCVSVASRARGERGKQTFLPVIGPDARVLRAYVARQHDEAAAPTSPLFYNVEHGRADRLARISTNSISYWLLELRLRARAKLGGRSRAAHVAADRSER